MRKGLILGLVAISISLTSVTVFTDVFAVANPTFDTSNIKTQRSAINLTDDAKADRFPEIHVRGSTVHVTWNDQTNQKTLYQRSTNMGSTWDAVITVGDNDQAAKPEMDVVGDYVYIAWTGAGSTTKFARSTNGGDSFGAVATINNGGRPGISAYGSNIDLIGWGGAGDDKIKFTRSTDNGANFGAISNAGDGGIVNAIDSSSNEIYIVSRTGANGMKLIKSTDGGTTFATSAIGTGTGYPTIQKSGSLLNVIWSSGGSLSYLISDDMGGTWSSAATVTSNWADVAPQYVNGTSHNVVWRHDGISGGVGQIFYSTSSDGITFDKAYQVSGLGVNYNGQEPAIGVNGTNVAIAFTGCTTNLASNQCDIFFARSTNGGLTFTTPGGSDQTAHVVATNSIETIFNATGIATTVIDIYNKSPSNDFTIITPNLNATIPASTTPSDSSHKQLTVKNSTRTINTTANPNASVVGTIQELGYTNSTKITFDKFIKLTFGGTTGTTPFFINATNTYLISQCAGTPATTTQVSSDATITGGANECYWSATNGTKFVWTNHFTAFGTGNNFGSSSSSSSSSSGGGKSSCDSSGFGMGQSLRVYQVSYDIMTQEVEVLAYSTCGAINAKIVTAGTQKILALSMDQPYLDEQKTVYKGKIFPDDTKFTILVENKRDSFDETFYITDSSIIREYGTGTGYTSEQQGMTYEKQSKVPEWVKNNAKWWSDSQVDDTTFSQGIGYLIKENIIEIDNLPSSSGDSDQSVPEWVKNNAKWWADGMISEDEFLRGITYMVENGIVKVQ